MKKHKRLIVALAVIDGVFKAIALWKSARRRQFLWFIAIAVFNTVGVLPIIYLRFFQQDVKQEV